MPTQQYPHPAWIEIDVKQFKKNISLIREYIGSSLFCLPVKSNAYGHGLCSIGKIAEEAGVNYLAVAHLQEGVQLRLSGVQIPILVFGAIHADQTLDLINFNLEITVSSKFKAKLLADTCKKIGKKCRVHLEIDTGMQRTGVRPSSASDLLQYLKDLACFDIWGVYSHLATADQPGDASTLKQIEDFTMLLQDPTFQDKPLLRHLANSGGTTFYPQSHLDMVRPGLLTFGYAPPGSPEILKKLAPCFSLKAKVSYFKVVPPETGISYGHSFVTQKQTRIVTVPLGYGDGYRRSLSNRGSVLIRGKRFPIVGTICMDQFMVDVGEEEVYVGDEVVLIGQQGQAYIPLSEIAELCDTIPYDILCFNERIPRIY